MPLYRLQNHPHVYERLSADGRLTSYQVKIRKAGFPTHVKSFDDLDAADRFVRAVLNDQDRGHKVDRLAGHRKTLGDVIDDAIDNLERGIRDVKGRSTEESRLRKFRRDQVALCATAMADLDETMWEDWLSERLEEVQPNTALREIRLLKPILKQAARRLDLRGSPMEFLKVPRVIDERVRRIDPVEEGLLFAELRKCEEPLVVEAAEFALETGCRRSELLRLDWRNFERKKGTIWLADAKNGRGRFILLSEKAQRVVEALPQNVATGPIFGISSNLLKKAFERARARAAGRARALGRDALASSIATLRWHDFRHEAISRCFDANWTTEQVMDFSGHVDVKSLLRYRHPKIDDAVARLRAIAPQVPSRVLPPSVIDARIEKNRVRMDA